MRKIALLAALFAQVSAGAQQKRTITFDDFAAVRAVSDPQPSPDGKIGALLRARRQTYRRTAAPGKHSSIPTSGGTAQVFPSADISATEARWSPDGKRVAYIAGGQLWVADATARSPKQLTQLNGGATGPSGRRPVIASRSRRRSIPTARPTRATRRRTKAAAESKVKAHIADQLMYPALERVG